MNRTHILGTGLAMLLSMPGATIQAQSSTGSSQSTARRSTTMPEAVLEILEQSQKSGKGVLVYMGSHAIGGAVTRIGEYTVELKSREYGRIVLRLDRIDGVAGN